MTYKPLILGVVTALAMAGGQANAASCPSSPETLSSFQALLASSGGSCTLSNETYDAFSFRDTTSNDRISFGTNVLAHLVSLAAPTGFASLESGASLDFTINTTGGDTITKATIGSHGDHGVGGTLMATMSGAGQTHTLSIDHNTTRQVLAPPFSASSVTVSDQIATVTHGTGNLNSFSDTFTVSPPAPPTPTPEPMSLSLFALGLAGLRLAARRRS